MPRAPTEEVVGEIGLLVSVVSVPMLVVDYTPIMDRYHGRTADEIEAALADDEELRACLPLPRQLGASRDWVRLYGFPYDDVAPDLVARQFQPEDYPELRAALTSQFLAPFRGDTSILSEHRAPTLAGDVIVRSHWKASIRDGVPDYTRIVIVDIDVTDLREVERSLEEVVEAKDRLIATISHELRNPLTAVVGFSDILTAEWDTLDDDTRREMAAEIGGQVGDMSALLEDLIAVNAGRALQIDAARVAIGDIIDGVDTADVEVEVDRMESVLADMLRVRQVVRNLVRNSVLHGGSRRHVTSNTTNGTVEIVVADDGPGVSEPVLERLFEPFSHGDRAGSLGLGLSVSRDLARAMGGDLVYRRDDGWSRFILRLPTA